MDTQENLPFKRINIFTSKVLYVMFAVMSLVLLTKCMNKTFGLKDDNIFEEAIEYEIREKTGIDIDISPFSPEFN